MKQSTLVGGLPPDVESGGADCSTYQIRPSLSVKDNDGPDALTTVHQIKGLVDIV